MAASLVWVKTVQNIGSQLLQAPGGYYDVILQRKTGQMGD
jgi:hypothetical protein